MKERKQSKTKLPPRTSVVLKPSARQMWRELAEHSKRSRSKTVEFLIEQEHARLFKGKAAA